ncbi:Lipid A core - O-antigen ligase and related enzymes [Veillonella criceti]|uniref:Lipid A core - O-antigen ligase and related enzymes n=1 Tax=Veillonella criceti TaxID=103891 RepID=A0A380NNF7_9FIRM|nr:O-antigen ligase family protein [Veillonella criceti]SUP44959.1 Lipid A core - O-antigen ligase and related enzymes [Veillonella criceti]
MPSAVCLDRGQELKQYITRLLYAIVLVMPLHQLLGDILVVLALVLSIWDTVRYRPLSKPASWLQWCVLGFMGWSLLSSLASTRPMFTAFSWLYNVGMYGAIYFLTYRYLREPEQWRTFLRIFIWSACIVCIVGVYQYMTMSMDLLQEWVDAKHFPLLKRRMFATLQNPNLFGEYLLIVLSVAGTGIFQGLKEKRWRLLAWMVPLSLFFLICMTLTYSRAIWISFACVIIYWGIVIDRRLLLSLLAIPAILFFYHGEVASRLWSLFDGNDTSAVLRWALWDSTTYMIVDYPVLGIGWDAFWFVYPHYNYYIQAPDVVIYHAHNMFLNVLAEIGLPGALFYFAAIYGHAVYALRLPKATISNIVKYGMGAVVVGVTISGLFDHDLFSHQVSVIFWQLLGWASAVLYTYKKNNYKTS